MPVTIHAITRYTVQVLTRKDGEHAHSSISVRLYDHDNVNRGTTVFERYGDGQPPKPVGDRRVEGDRLHGHRALTRLHGHPAPGESHVSIDTKKEVIGEFFGRSS